jgi:hypothetical protein
VAELGGAEGEKWGRSAGRSLYQPQNIAVDADWMAATSNVLQAGGTLRDLFDSKKNASKLVNLSRRRNTDRGGGSARVALT